MAMSCFVTVLPWLRLVVAGLMVAGLVPGSDLTVHELVVPELEPWSSLVVARLVTGANLVVAGMVVPGPEP